MICRHCGIEFDTTGIVGDAVRCPRCGMLYRRKAPPAPRDPRAGLNVPVFIPKAPAGPVPSPVPSVQAQMPAAVSEPVRPQMPEQIPASMPNPVRPNAQVHVRPSGAAPEAAPPRPAGTPQRPAPRDYENRNGYPGGPGTGAVPGRKPAEKRKKTHHIRTALLLILALVIAGIILTLTGVGDIFPRPAEKDEGPAREEQTVEQPVEEPDDSIEWFG